MSEWLSFNANSAIFQLYHGQNKLIFNEMMSALYWNNSPRVDMSLHIILIPSQPIFALSSYCCVLSGEATNTNFIVFGLTRSGLEPMIYRTRGEHANHYTTDVVSSVYDQ